MKVLFYVGFGLVFLIINSCAWARPLPFLSSYDTMVCLVLCATLYRPDSEAVAACLGLGLAMDAVSVCPMGLHVLAYLCVFVTVSWVPRFFEVDNAVLLSVASVAAVLVEEAVFAAAAVFAGSTLPPVDPALARLGQGAFAAAATGWVVILFLAWILKNKVALEKKRSGINGQTT